MDWAAVGAISSVIATIAIVVSLPFIWFQLREANNARKAEAFFRVTEYLQEEDIRFARRYLLNIKKQFSEWTEEDKLRVEKVCISYNRVGRMVRMGMIPEDYVLPLWHYSIQVCWEAARPLVEFYRNTRTSDRWQDFEWLYQRALKSYSRV